MYGGCIRVTEGDPGCEPVKIYDHSRNKTCPVEVQWGEGSVIEETQVYLLTLGRKSEGQLTHYTTGT